MYNVVKKHIFADGGDSPRMAKNDEQNSEQEEKDEQINENTDERPAKRRKDIGKSALEFTWNGFQNTSYLISLVTIYYPDFYA